MRRSQRNGRLPADRLARCLYVVHGTPITAMQERGWADRDGVCFPGGPPLRVIMQVVAAEA